VPSCVEIGAIAGFSHGIDKEEVEIGEMKGLIKEERKPGRVTLGGLGIRMDEMWSGWSMEVST